MKNFFLLLLTISFSLPVIADDGVTYNMGGNLSKFYNPLPSYTQIKKTLSASDVIEERNEAQYKVKSVKEFYNEGAINRNTQMNYGQFPFNNSNMMNLPPTMQQNMIMGL